MKDHPDSETWSLIFPERITMNSLARTKAKIKQAWEENPLAVIAIGSGAVIAVTKIVDSMTASRNSRTWRKEVVRRERKATRKV